MELVIADDYTSLLTDGVKTSTVRQGRREVSPGEPIRFTNRRETFTFASKVDTVTYKRFKSLTADDAKKDGFGSLKELKEGLLTHYPNIHDNSVVTVIAFEEKKNGNKQS